MGKTTGIEWTDHTFNIAWGCMKVSDGCKNCYADTLSHRFGFDIWGPAATTSRRTFGEKHWREPLAWNAAAAKARTRRRVFCSSMCDLFEDHPTVIAELAKLWPLIQATPQLDWQLLTKRPERIAASLPADWGDHGWPNVWLGTSVENEENRYRIPKLLEVPARLHFLSLEPLLGPVSLFGAWHDYLRGWDCRAQHTRNCSPDEGCAPGCPDAEQFETHKIGWVIAGGESGPRCRPMDNDWVRVLRGQCAAAGVPYLLKQLGGDPDPRDHDKAVLDGITHKQIPAIR